MQVASEGLVNARETMYPSEAHIIEGFWRSALLLRYATIYGYCFDSAAVKVDGEEHHFDGGDYFSFPVKEFVAINTVASDLPFAPQKLGVVAPSVGKVVLFVRYGYLGQKIAGTVESTGRLSYVDGCSDSMLVYPPRKGDPTFNHLHFPEGIEQSWHTHPTIRIGVVTSGAVRAEYKEGHRTMRIGMKAGDVFLLEEHEIHRFVTDMNEANIVIYHPDSDWGPEDHNHTMLNRTYLRK
jgi:quercetin dioxygenase-like cupin family protein